MKKQSNGWKDFVKRYGKYFIAFLIASILIYSIIYLCFIGDGFLSAGKDLAKEDWLSFLGAYLSFIGTVAVSLIALFQSSYYTKTENERRLYEHRKKIQPIFSVDIVEMNKQIDGTSEAFNLSKEL